MMYTKPLRSTWPVMLVIAGVLGGPALHAGLAAGAARSTSVPATRPAITVSPETTHIVKPLGFDGLPDYLAAWNALACGTIRPQDNAAVPLLRICGPGPYEHRRMPLVLKHIDIKALPPGPEFVSLRRYVFLHAKPEDLKPVRVEEMTEAEKIEADAVMGEFLDGLPPKVRKMFEPAKWRVPAFDKAQERFYKAEEGPWQKKDFPEIAAWLAMNDEALDAFIEATRRPSLYLPTLLDADDVNGRTDQIVPTYVGAIRPAMWALQCRALLDMGEGRLDRAWAASQALFRLARLLTDSPTLVQALVAQTCEAVASQVCANLALGTPIPAKQARIYAQTLAHMGDLPSLQRPIASGERIGLLAAVLHAARHAPASSPLRNANRFDWDSLLRQINHRFDQLAQVLSQETYLQQKHALEELQTEVARSAIWAKDVESAPWGPMDTWLGRLLAARGKQPSAAENGQSVADVLLVNALRSYGVAIELQPQGNTRRDLACVAMALAAYRAEHKEYPRSLAALSPGYLNRLPTDRFSGRPLKYVRLDPKRYEVYSVGPNGRDHREDAAGLPKWKRDDDDIIVPRPR